MTSAPGQIANAPGQAPAPAADQAPPRPPTPWQALWKSRTTRACLVVVALFALAALAGEIARDVYLVRDATPPWQVQDLAAAYLPPSAAHPCGTDGLGRDVFLRLLQGARISFLVGIVSSLIAIPLGLLLGAIAGYCGKWIDETVVWLCTTFSAIPGLLFVLAIAMVVGKGLFGVFVALGLTTWTSTCRLIRAETIRHRSFGYALAARALGFSGPRILFRHILPNVAHVALVSFTLRFPAAIGTEVFLSFLGIGVQDEPSWGTMLSSARLRLWQGVWWELAAVTLAIFLVVLAFNLLGDALRDALDPRLRSRPQA